MEDKEGRKIPQRMPPLFPPFPPTSPQTLGPMTFLVHKTSFTSRSDLSDADRPSEQTGLSNEEIAFIPRARENPPKYVPKYTWEYSLLLQLGPDGVRKEVDILISDLIVRLKQLLFNSLFCAYYVGFIPMQFADVSAWEWNLVWV